MHLILLYAVIEDQRKEEVQLVWKFHEDQQGTLVVVVLRSEEGGWEGEKEGWRREERRTEGRVRERKRRREEDESQG